MEKENKITIIVPTHNRHAYIRQRTIPYLSQYNIPTIICDSSPLKFDIDLLPPIFQYYHMPDMSYEEKMNAGLANVDTEFVMMCADDDFIVIETLLEGVKFLETENSYVLYAGKQARFDKDFNGDIYSKYTKSIQYIGENLTGNFHDKCRKIFSNFQQTFYAIYRTQTLKNAFKFLLDYRFFNGRFAEIVLILTAIRDGDVAFSEQYLSVREVNPTSSSGTTMPAISWDRIFTNKVMRRDVKKYKKFCLNFEPKLSPFKMLRYTLGPLHKYLTDSIKWNILKLVKKLEYSDNKVIKRLIRRLEHSDNKIIKYLNRKLRIGQKNLSMSIYAEKISENYFEHIRKILNQGEHIYDK